MVKHILLDDRRTMKRASHLRVFASETPKEPCRDISLMAVGFSLAGCVVIITNYYKRYFCTVSYSGRVVTDAADEPFTA